MKFSGFNTTEKVGIGVGTSVPEKDLTVQSATSPAIGLYSTYADTNSRNWAINTNNSAYGDFTISTSAARLGNPTTIKMSILKDGNVGIGTTAPVAQLNLFKTGADDAISSSLYFQRAAGNYGCAILQVGNGSAGTEKLMFTAGHNSNPVHITNAKMTIQQDGKVGIGTTSPAYNLHIKPASGNARLKLESDSNTADVEMMLDSASSTRNAHITFYNAGTQKGGVGYQSSDTIMKMWGGNNPADDHLCINSSGSVGIGTPSPSVGLEVAKTSADASFKVNRTDQTNIQLIAAGSSYVRASAALILQSNGANNRLTLAADGSSTFAGTLTVNGTLTGTSATLSGVLNFNNGSDNCFRIEADSGKDTYINSYGSGNFIQFKQNGAAVLSLYQTYLAIPDSTELRFGASSDLRIYHDGSNSYIKDTGTGGLVLATSRLSINNAASNEEMISAIQNGAVELFYDNSKKLETTSGGISVTGTGTFSTAVAVGDAYIYTNYIRSSNLRVTDNGYLGSQSVPSVIQIQGDGDVAIGYPTTINSSLKATTILDASNSAGTNGQVLTSTGSALDWKTLSEISGVDGSGTANYIPKWTDSDTVGNSTIYTDGQDVAIGSTAFGVGGTIDLSVGSPGSTAGGITLWNTTTGIHSIGFGDANSGTARYEGYLEYSHADNSMRFGTVHAERMRITSNGQVGIGTTSPSRILTINDATLPCVQLCNGQTGTAAGDGYQMQLSGVTGYLFNYDGQIIFGTSATVALTLDTSQNATFNGLIKAGNLSISGQEIDVSSGDLTLDVAGDIILDADSGAWRFKDNGGSIIELSVGAGSSPTFYSPVSNADILFRGNDGGSAITALTLDMSDAGTAIFNHDIKLAALPSTTVNAAVPILFRPTEGTLSGDTALTWNPAADSLDVNGTVITSNHIRSSGTNSLKLGSANGGIIMYLTATGDVGIGTTTPNSTTNKKTLEINATWGGVIENSVSGTVKSRWDWSTGGITQFGTYVNEPLHLMTNSAMAVTILANGNVGIGDSTPSHLLHIRKDQNAKTSLLIDNRNGGTGASASIFLGSNHTTEQMDIRAFGSAFTTSGADRAGGGLVRNSQSGGLSIVASNAAGETRFYTAGSADGNERMRITSGGKVGIGCTNPQNAFNVQVGTDHRIGFWGTSTYSAIQSVNDANTVLKKFRFDASEYQFMGGKVGIGTDAPDSLGLNIARASTDPTASYTGNSQLVIGLVGSTTHKLAISRDTNGDNAYIHSYQDGVGAKNLILQPGGGIVGIGTTAPGARLELSQADASAGLQMLRIRNFATSATGAFTGDYVAEIRSAYTSAATKGALLVHTQEANNSRPTMSVSDSNGIFATFVNGNVGIGTVNAPNLLTLKGDSKYLAMYASDGSEAVRLGVDSSGDGQLRLMDGGGNTRIFFYGESGANSYINNGGKVGIGTTAPAAELQINGSHTSVNENAPYGTNSTHLNLKNTSDTDGNLVGVLFEGAVGAAYMGGMYMEMENHSSFHSKLHFATRNAGSFGSKMTLTKDGKVGIGTTVPDSNLSIVNTSGIVGMNIKAATNNVAYIDFGDSGDSNIGGINYNNSDDTLNLRAGNANRLTISSSGTVFMPNGSAFAFANSSGVIQSVLSLNSSNAMVLGGTGMATNAYPIRNIAKYITFEPAGGLGTGIETMRITNSSFAGVGSVGIGTTAPEAALHVVGGIHLNNASAISWDQAGGTLRNAIRVDSGDDLHIGDTNFDDIRFSTGQKTDCLIIKQSTGDINQAGGAYVLFNGAGATVGRIFTLGGNNLTICGTQLNHCGLSFATNAILPATEGATNNNTVDLGANGNAFKDFYIQGTAYVRNSGGHNVLWGKGTGWGYSPNSYRAIQIGDASGNNTVSIGYDPAGNTNGSFTGDGGELLFRNNMTFMTPNAADNGWHPCMHFQDGKVQVGSASAASSPLQVTIPASQGLTDFGGVTFQETANRRGLSMGWDNSSGYFWFYSRDVGVASRGINLNNALYVKSLGGNVGIGVTAPGAKLHVTGAPGNSTYLSYLFNSATHSQAHGLNVQIASSGAAAYGLRVNTGGDTNSLAVMGDGKVGIGTAAPGVKLHVYGGNIRISSTNDKPQLEFFETAAARWVIGHSTAPNNYFAISEGSDVAVSERLVIAPSTGSVGIGTINPTNNLVVYATGHQVNFVTETDDHSGMRVKGADAKDKYILFNNQCKLGYQHSTATLHLCRSGAFGDNHLVINSNGNVGIGTATPGKALEVIASGNSDGIEIGSSSGHIRVIDFTRTSTSANPTARIQVMEPGSTHTSDMRFYTSDAVGGPNLQERMIIDSDGSVGIGTNNPGTLLHVNGAMQSKTLSVLGDGTSLPFLSTSGGNNMGTFFSTLTTYARLRINIAAGGDSQLSFMSDSTSKWSIGNDGGDSHKFKIKVGFGEFSGAEKFMIQADGNIGIGTNAAGYKFHVQGDILASGSIMGNSKSFVIDHPTKPNNKLQYGALEGPEFGVYHRGRAQSNTITLPDYWTALVREETITVQLTPKGSFQHLYVVSQSLTEIVIGAADGETIDCFYTIYAERADIDRLEVEKEV